MTNVIVHLGLHKTATGTLQRQFFPACEGLNILTTAMPEVKVFIEEVARRDPLFFDVKKAKEIIFPFLDAEKVNLLSNESLSGPPYAGVIEAGLDHRSPVLNNLSKVLPEAKAILVLRRQDGLAKSFYREYLKSGGTRRVRRFYGLEFGKGPALMSLDRFYFLKYVEAVVSSFPAGVLILPFEKFIYDQNSFLKAITDFSGVAMPDIELKSENATRLGPAGMQVSRVLNHIFRSLVNPAGIFPGVRVMKMGVKQRVNPVQLLHDKWPKSSRVNEGETSKVALEIFRMVQQDNKELDEKFNLNLKNYNYYD